jgi:hypothetical protein
VAQLVEHHLAKVGVAGSNPVVRSRSQAVSGREAFSVGDTLGDSAGSAGRGLPPERVANVLIVELYRYRLAMHDPTPRVAGAMQVVTEERIQAGETPRDLLFHPNTSSQALRERLEAIQLREMPSIWRLKSEAEFQLMTIYGLYSISKG